LSRSWSPRSCLAAASRPRCLPSAARRTPRRDRARSCARSPPRAGRSTRPSPRLLPLPQRPHPRPAVRRW